jgi:PAS domain S-box-containing protein
LNQQMAERQKRLETQERRISQLTQPHGDLSSLRFEDLFDVDEIQKIQDAFSASTGVASIITDPQGKPITKPSNFCRFCMDIIRGTPQGLANCMQSDAVLGRMGPGGYAMQPCLSGGLWDGGTPIAVGDHHIGNWLIGQVLDSSLDIERMVEYAVSLGADEAESRKAVADIPRMSVVQFGKVCQALYLIAQQLSKFAMQNLLQARYMTEQARAEEERYRCLFETMTQGVVYQAEDGTIVSANPAAERIFGLSEKEIIGKTALIGDWGAVREDGSEFIADDYPMMVALRTGQPVHDVVMGIYNAKNDTETWIVVNAIPLFRPGEKIPYQVYATLDDITERKAVEKEREEMQVQRLHSQKMESVGQLAAGIAHEINTPTQFIGDNTRFLQDAFSDLMELLEKYEVVRTEAKQGAVSSDLMEELDGLIEKNDLAYLKEEIPPAIERSLVGIERVTKIVRAMKEFSHPGGNEYTLFDINRAIESTVTVAENEWKYVAELETDFDPSLPMVSCLPGPFNQVILNMIVNAAHAITEKISAGEKGRGRIWISTRRKDQEVEIRIADTGMGIPENIQDRIFDPFFTTKEVGKGTGQGLAIAYSVIVEQHHGTIQVESKVGVGTTFILRIPV